MNGKLLFDVDSVHADIDPRGNVFIVEMKKAEHASVVARLIRYFKVPNGAHYQPRGRDKPFAPDIAIYPGLTILPKPPIPAPPSQRRLNFHPPRPSRHLEILAVDKSVGSVVGCNGNLVNYQVKIPTQDVFWNPSIIRRAFFTDGYVITVSSESPT
ncbi:6374_t:CDS:2 [Gigaspora rosea]|nr:6374_t:CDS:2 [Gigaspora rosea]